MFKAELCQLELNTQENRRVQMKSFLVELVILDNTIFFFL